MDPTEDNGSDAMNDCVVCGLRQATFSTKLHTPFTSQRFDFSREARRTAQHIVKEGNSRISDLNHAIE